MKHAILTTSLNTVECGTQIRVLSFRFTKFPARKTPTHFSWEASADHTGQLGVGGANMRGLQRTGGSLSLCMLRIAEEKDALIDVDGLN